MLIVRKDSEETAAAANSDSGCAWCWVEKDAWVELKAIALASGNLAQINDARLGGVRHFVACRIPLPYLRSVSAYGGLESAGPGYERVEADVRLVASFYWWDV